jgi:hypothetical protein
MPRVAPAEEKSGGAYGISALVLFGILAYYFSDFVTR